jgi:hypothetical protein
VTCSAAMRPRHALQASPDCVQAAVADGQTREISRSLQNVRDPYREVGQLLRSLMPAAAGNVLPRFPTIDEIIAACAGKPGPRT